MEIYQNLLRWYKEVPLSDRERKIVEYRHGLTDNTTHTLEETGKVFGLTRERIRQIESSLFEKLRLHIKDETGEDIGKGKKRLRTISSLGDVREI